MKVIPNFSVPLQNCTRLVEDPYLEPGLKSISDVSVFNVVFAQHIPKNGEILTPWMSYLRVLFYPTLRYKNRDESKNVPSDKRIHLVAKIGYRVGVLMLFFRSYNFPRKFFFLSNKPE